MMGSKARHFAPLMHISLEELVPQDHFYRHLERTLDLSFVREFVQETYSDGGRPSIERTRVFQAATPDLFRGHALGTSAHAPCGRSTQRSLVREGMTWENPGPIIKDGSEENLVAILPPGHSGLHSHC
jgi:hypothetical protein